MADNEYITDGDVQRITAAELMPILPSQGGGFRLMYRVEFKDGRTQLRTANQCSCPLAIREYERQYYRAKYYADPDHYETSSGPSASPAPSSSQSKSEASGFLADADDEATPSKASRDGGEGSEYADDAHLNHMSSDDSNWPSLVDAQGRPGTDPEARAAIRKEWAAHDETFKTPKTEGSGSSDSDDVSGRTRQASVKSEALSDDSLAQELMGKGNTPASPDNGPGSRIDRRRKAARLLPFGKPAHEKTFEEWAYGRKKIASDPNLPSGSGLQVLKKRKAGHNVFKGVGLQRHKKIKVERDENSPPAMPAVPAGPSESSKKAVEVIDLTLDDEIFTIDSD